MSDNQFIQLLSKSDLLWSINVMGRGEESFIGLDRSANADNDAAPFYEIVRADADFAKKNAPLRLNEAVVLSFGNPQVGRIIELTFGTFYELLAFLDGTSTHYMNNWFHDAPGLRLHISFLTEHSMEQYMIGRNIAMRVNPIKKETMTFDELIKRITINRILPESLSDFCEELYYVDRVALDAEDDVNARPCCNSHEDSQDFAILVGENYNTDVSVTQIVNHLCAPRYQIFFELKGVTYFYGSEHSAFLY